MHLPKIHDPFLVTLLYADARRLPPEVILDAVDTCPWIPEVLSWVHLASADLQYGPYTVRQGLRARAIPMGTITEEAMQKVQAHLYVESIAQNDGLRRSENWRWYYTRPTDDEVHDLTQLLRRNFEVAITRMQPNLGPFALVEFADVEGLHRYQDKNSLASPKCDLQRTFFQSREDLLDWGIGLLEEGFGAHEDDGTGTCRRCRVTRDEVARWNQRRPEPWVQRRFAGDDT